MSTGAIILQKIVKKLQSRHMPSFLKLSSSNSDLLRIEKCSGETGNQVEFSFTIRVEKFDSKEIWWPIEYIGKGGEIARTESIFNGKTMVNLQTQNDLVNLAETWAKTLEAQLTTKTVSNALI